MFSIYFTYSYTGGKFQHNYRGFFFREVAYTAYDVACFVEEMDQVLVA
jgi:hypothetical protein